jgi:hypothetical protein
MRPNGFFSLGASARAVLTVIDDRNPRDGLNFGSIAKAVTVDHKRRVGAAKNRLRGNFATDKRLPPMGVHG